MHRLLTLVIVGAVSLNAAQIAALAFETFTLDNGVTIVVHTKTDTPLVALHAFVKTGAALERDYLGCGVSHFVEHVVFGTTTARTEQEVKRLARKLGDTHNAYTTEDQTCFHMTTMTNRWPLMAEIIADQVARYTFPSNEVAREQSVITQEIRMGEEDPDTVLWELLLQTAYIVSPLRVPIAGYLTPFQNVTRADLIRYYRSVYVANNMIVVLVGPLTRAEALPVLQRTFGTIPRGRETPRAIPDEPPVLAPRRAEREHTVNNIYGCIAFPTVSELHPDAPALEMLARLLGDGELSPLVNQLKNRDRLVTDIAAFSWSPSLGRGLLMIEFQCEPAHEAAAAAGIANVCAAARDRRFAPEDLARLQRAYALEFARELQTVDGIAGTLGNGACIAGDPGFAAAYAQAFMQVTVTDVQRVAQTYIRSNATITALLRPRGMQPTTAPATASAIAAMLTFDLTTLTNGVRILTRSMPSPHIAAVHICLPGGAAYETADNNGISALRARLISKGTAKRTAEEIATLLESRGARVQFEAQRDALHGRLECAPEDLEDMLALLADMVLNSVFPIDELENARRLQLADIRTHNDEWEREALQNFRRAAYGADPYALPLVGASSVVARITRDDLQHAQLTLLQPARIVIAIAGAIDGPAAVAAAARAFGRLPAPAQPWLPASAPVRIQRDQRTVFPARRTQATVVLGYPAPRANQPMYPAAMLLDSYLGGLNGQLFDVLRGDADLVYVVYSDLVSDERDGRLVAVAQCSPDNVAIVRQKMSSAIDTLYRLPLAPDVLADVKSALAVTHARAQQSFARQAHSAALWEYRGLGAGFPDAACAAAARLTPEQLQDCAAAYFTGMTWAVTTPQAPVRRITSFLRRFPTASPQDVYKVLYQGVCGPGHLLQDGVALERALEQEWERVPAMTGRLWMAIGIEADWSWLNLGVWKGRGGTLPPLKDTLWQSIHASHADRATVSQYWAGVVAAVDAGTLPLASNEVHAFTDMLIERNYPVVHHTERFIKDYQPAYRVLSRRLAEAAGVRRSAITD